MTMTPVTDKTDSVEAGRHTPGPWWVAGKGTIRWGDPKSSRTGWIGTVNWRDKEANARLIAAAPDLLEAAQKVLAHLEARIEGAPSNAVPVFDGIAELHDAISKAEGRP